MESIYEPSFDSNNWTHMWDSFKINKSILSWEVYESFLSVSLRDCIFSVYTADVQGVVSCLEEQFSPKVQAEFSVLVDVLHSPELLFPEAARLRCESGAFMSK